ncbi:MAG: hypothetical protein JWP25_9022 [Bradyrhizobium sp.]|nr:hypothetical protein [Bradyrhizobium sp.]
MLVMAIDPATKSGFCEGATSATPRICTVNFRHDASDGPEDICGHAIAWFADRMKSNPPNLIAIEQPFPSQSFDTSLITLGLYAIFTGIAKCKDVELLTVPIQTWRKYFLGRGNLKGDEAKRQCVKLCAQLGWKADDHNGAEAAGIFSFACSQVAPRNVVRVEPLFARAAS